MRLRDAIATPEGKRRYVRRLFTTIADRYDFITRALSYGQDRRWKRTVIDLAALRSTDRVLDLACGTGDLVEAAARAGCRAVGLDVTWRMLEIAAARRRNLQGLSGQAAPARYGAAPSARPPAIHQLIQGDMLLLPFRNASFTVVTTGYGLRNVPDLSQAIAEIERILVPGGRLLSLDFDRPERPFVRKAYLAYLTIVGGVLGRALHGDPDTYRYIAESIRRYPGARAVARLLEQRGFDVRVVTLMGGLMAIHVARAPGDQAGGSPVSVPARVP